MFMRFRLIKYAFIVLAALAAINRTNEVLGTSIDPTNWMTWVVIFIISFMFRRVFRLVRFFLPL